MIRINTSDVSSVEQILAQLIGIKEFPSTIHIYDRSFPLSSLDELLVLMNGFETGWFVREEFNENKKDKTNV